MPTRRLRRAPCCAAIISALALAAAAACALPSAALAANAQPAVVSAMNGFTLYSQASDQWAPALGAMAANGVSLVRSDAPWAVVQANAPEPSPSYDFSSLDPWVAALAQAGVTWTPVLDDTPGWAKDCTGQCPPLDMSWFAEFAGAVAARYGTNGTFWQQNPSLPYHPVTDFEIWNEENGTQFWSTGPSGAQYATMYADARAAIKSVDPSGQAIVGGLGTGDASDFVQDMFAAMPSLHGNVDGFGLHPYEATAVGDEQDVIVFRQTLDSLGESSAPIDLTEFGWTVGQNTNSEDTRAWMMDQLGEAFGNSNCGIEMLVPYAWVNDTGDPPDYALTSDGTTLMSGGAAWFDGLQLGESGAVNDLCPAAATGTTGGTGTTGTSGTGTKGSTPTPPTNSGPGRKSAPAATKARGASAALAHASKASSRRRLKRHRRRHRHDRRRARARRHRRGRTRKSASRRKAQPRR